MKVAVIRWSEVHEEAAERDHWTMAPRHRDPGLGELIAEITVDCNDEDEELMGFECAFDEEATLPCPGSVIGEDVQVLSVAREHGRRELVATCEHDGRNYQIALLDVELKADPATERLLAAYRWWAECR
ncbi:MAG: calcium-binding protein [Acidimicrobiales bacterium]